MGLKPPLLLHSQHICCKYIIKHRGKILRLAAVYQLLLDDIKVKKLDKFLAFSDSFLDDSLPPFN